ncbi:hypothetical protein [Mesobacillus harenae]|nr:hypothetical protein [Mesobacillus harenae]
MNCLYIVTTLIPAERAAAHNDVADQMSVNFYQQWNMPLAAYMVP